MANEILYPWNPDAPEAPAAGGPSFEFSAETLDRREVADPIDEEQPYGAATSTSTVEFVENPFTSNERAPTELP